MFAILRVSVLAIVLVSFVSVKRCSRRSVVRPVDRSLSLRGFVKCEGGLGTRPTDCYLRAIRYSSAAIESLGEGEV